MPDDKAAKLWLSQKRVAEILEMTSRVLGWYVSAGLLPKPHIIGNGRKVWFHEEIPFMLWLIRNQDRFPTAKAELAKIMAKAPKDDDEDNDEE